MEKKETMNRRDLLTRGTALTGGLLTGLAMQADKANAQTAPRASGSSDANAWNVIITGETMAVRPFSMHKEPEFQSIIKLMRESDVTYSHLEMNFGSSERQLYAARGAAGAAGYLIAEPKIAEELKWAGVDLLSLANNHSMDWGPEGMLSTIEVCNKVGITGAGTGRDLEESRTPGFCEKDKGRVSLVSLSAGNSAYEWAGLAKGQVPGRPGVNPMRATMKYQLDHETAEQYKAGAKKLGVLSLSKANPNEFNVTPGAQSGVTGYAGFTFVDGDKFEISTVAYNRDVEANLRAIRHAREMSDFVMVALHTSLSEGGRGDLPCKFAREFAQAAVDAGADMFIGHGWHKVLGIEIYKNKPLLHGLGNFFWQSSYIPRVPADEYEAYGYDVDKMTSYDPAIGPLHPAGDQHWAYSAIFQLKFENKKVTEIVLHPIEMGMDFTGPKPRPTRLYAASGGHPILDGRPLMAKGANAQWILQRIAKLCSTYGTKVDIQNGVGVIKVA